MKKLFSPGSKFMEKLTYLYELIFLNLIFLVTSIPIFTIGASKTALYYTMRHITDYSDSHIRMYFRSFQENFRQSIGLLAMIAVPELISLLLIYSFTTEIGLFPVRLILMIPASAVLMVNSYVFPLLSRYENDSVTTLKNAFILATANGISSGIVTFIRILPVLILFFLEASFAIRLMAFWILFAFAQSARIQVVLLQKVFDNYEEDTLENTVDGK